MLDAIETPSPKVFISYSHGSQEHQDQVLMLADRLRADGVDAYCDQYEGFPAEGWPRWMERQLCHADFVLMICSASYRKKLDGDVESGSGLGVAWEGKLIRDHLYAAGTINRKFVPVLLAGCQHEDIPPVVRGMHSFNAFTENGYEALLRVLTNQPGIPPPKLGKLRQLPPRLRRMTATSRDSSPQAENRVVQNRSMNLGKSVKLSSAAEKIGQTAKLPVMGIRFHSLLSNRAMIYIAAGLVIIVTSGLAVPSFMALHSKSPSSASTVVPSSAGDGAEQYVQIRVYASQFGRDTYEIFQNDESHGTATKYHPVELTVRSGESVICRKSGLKDLIASPSWADSNKYYCEK